MTSPSTLQLEGEAGIGSEIVRALTDHIGQPSLINFSEDRGYYVEFEGAGILAHVWSKKSNDSWICSFSWSVEDEQALSPDLLAYLETFDDHL